MWEFRIRNELWRIPAASREEAERILCRCLFVDRLPPEARFVRFDAQ